MNVFEMLFIKKNVSRIGKMGAFSRTHAPLALVYGVGNEAEAVGWWPCSCWRFIGVEFVILGIVYWG